MILNKAMDKGEEGVVIFSLLMFSDSSIITAPIDLKIELDTH